MDPEAAGGAALVPALALERPQHVGLLEAVARLAERRRARVALAPRGRHLVHGQLQRQVVEPDHRARGQRHAALDDVLELAHVPRPVVVGEGHARPAREPAHVLLELPRVLAHEVGGQVGHVRLPLAQRRHADRHHVQPVVEILAERARPGWPVAGRMLVAAMTRTSTWIVRVPPRRSISRCWRARSSLACRSTRRLPTSSRKSVPPWASSNLPGLRAYAPVKAPFSWPKSSDSSSESGIAARLTATKGCARRGLWLWMARATSSLPVPLSAVISTRGVRLRHLRDQLVEPHHPRMPPDQLVEAVGPRELAPEVVQLALHPALLGGLAHQAQDLVHVEGLGQVVVGARLHGVHRHAQVGIRGDQDHRDRVVDGQDLRQHPGAGLAGHPHVEQGHVDPAGAQDRRARPRRRRPPAPRTPRRG